MNMLFDRFERTTIKPRQIKGVVLEREEVAYLYYKDNVQNHILIPSFSRNKKVSIKCYELKGKDWKITDDREIIFRLMKPLIESFASGCRGAANSIIKKISNSRHKGYDYKLIIPKMGGLILYQFMSEFMGYDFGNEVLVDYSSGFHLQRRHKMKKAFSDCIKPVINGKKKGVCLIILDEFVSGASVDAIFHDFKTSLDKYVNINLDEEKKFCEDMLYSRYKQYYQKTVVRRRIELKRDYTHYFDQIIKFLKGNRKKSKTYLLMDSKNTEKDLEEYLSAYTQELREFFSKFEQDFFEYLTSKEFFKYRSLKQKTLHQIQIIKDMLSSEGLDKSKLAETMYDMKRNYMKIMDISMDDSSITLAMNRKIYEDWMKIFNIELFFVTVKDKGKANKEIEKMKQFYKDVTERGLHDTFAVSHILTVDRISIERRAEIEKYSKLPSIEEYPEFLPILEFTDRYYGILTQ